MRIFVSFYKALTLFQTQALSFSAFIPDEKL